MAGYPSGGWDLDNYDQFYAWSLHLKKLQPTKSLRDAVLLLLDMHARLERVLVPEEAEEESSEDYEPVSSAESWLALLLTIPRPLSTDHCAQNRGFYYNDIVIVCHTYCKYP